MKKLLLLIVLFVSAISFSQTPELADEYWDKAEEAHKNKNWKNAAILYLEFVEVENKCETPRLKRIADGLYNVAISFEKNQQYDSAIKYYEDSIDSVKSIYGEKHSKYKKYLTSLGNLFYKLEEYDKAITVYQETLKSEEQSLINNNRNYIYLKNLANAYYANEQYHEAIPLYEEAQSNSGIQNTQIQVEILSLLTSSLNWNLQHDKAIVYGNKVLALIEKISNDENPEYFNCLDNLAFAYQEKAEYDKAILYYDKALVSIENKFGKENKQYHYYLKNILYSYTQAGRFKISLPLAKELLRLSKLLFGSEHDEHISSLQDLSTIYIGLEQYEKSLDTINEAIEIVSNSNSESGRYFSVLGTKWTIYKAIGQYEEALKVAEQLFELAHKIPEINDLEYSAVLDHLASSYIDTNQYEKALPLFEESLNITEKIVGKEHLDYITSLNNLAIVHGYLNQTKQSADITIEVLDKTEKLIGKNNEVYGTNLNNLAILYKDLGEYDKALTAFLEAKQIFETSVGKDNSFYYRSILAGLSNLYKDTGEYEKMILLCQEINYYGWSKLNSILSFSGEEQSSNYIKMVIRDFHSFQYFSNKAEYKYPELIELNLNNLYRLKGILLSNYTSKINDLNKLNDPIINKLIDDYRTSYALLSNQISKPKINRTFSIDSLQNLVEAKESQLFKKHKEAYKTKDEVVDWKSIQKNLKSNETVIEFSKYSYKKNGIDPRSYYYVAYVYNKESITPKAVYLFNEKELKNLLSKKKPSNLYDARGSKGKSLVSANKDLYNLVWKPLEQYIQEDSSVYFSPDGYLNQIAFAALPDNNGNLNLEKYNLHQMSNTANLITISKDVEKAPAVFAGGIQYDFNPDKASFNQKEKVSVYLFDTSKRSNKNGTWQYLPGTEEEANKLNELYKEKNLNTTIVTGAKATEEWFKSLSGNSPKVLHLATHGFFFEDIKDTLSHGNQQPKYTLAEDPLLRSGLVLADGNYTWQHGTNPYKEEDGILTAYEISKLDFQNTAMVVLSACETGLGDIDGSEGVYGLQRAFKMAGVDILVMSLWEVPDTETAEFMNIFYTNWLNGAHIREAFRNTQLEMSNKYKDNPEKWAAFVLIE